MKELRVVGKNFKELKVWQKANELCFEMYNITKDFSPEKKLGLTSQNSLLEKLAKVKNVIKKKTLNLKIPPGVDNGSQLRLVGEGGPGRNGGPPGDLYVVLHVEPHDFFERDGDDLLCQIPISFPQASLGAEIEIPVLEGSDILQIPKGTQTGDVVSLRNQGMPNLRSGKKGSL